MVNNLLVHGSAIRALPYVAGNRVGAQFEFPDGSVYISPDGVPPEILEGIRSGLLKRRTCRELAAFGGSRFELIYTAEYERRLGPEGFFPTPAPLAGPSALEYSLAAMPLCVITRKIPNSEGLGAIKAAFAACFEWSASNREGLGQLDANGPMKQLGTCIEVMLKLSAESRFGILFLMLELMRLEMGTGKGVVVCGFCPAVRMDATLRINPTKAKSEKVIEW